MATLSQFMAFFVLVLFAPNYTVAPSWVYIASGVFILMYQLFDNCDGKQARRTGNATPLGQLFDHGSDCICVVFASAFTLATLGTTRPWMQLLYLCVFQFAFFLPTYEEYHTGCLYLGTLNGADDGVFLSAVLEIFTGVVGGNFWRLPVFSPAAFWAAHPTFASRLRFLLPSWMSTLGDVMYVVISIAGIMTTLPSVVHVVRFFMKQKGSAEESKEHNPSTASGGFGSALLRLVPLTSAMVLNILWHRLDPELIVIHPFLFQLLAHIPVFSMTVRLIIDHVSEQEYPIFHPVLLGYLVPIGVGLLLWATGGSWTPVIRCISLIVYVSYTLGLSLRYCANVMLSIAQKLEIRIFHVNAAK